MLLVKGLTEADGMAAAKQILTMNPLPDGVFITNDFVAAVCMREFRKQGLSIPEDIAIVGFNNDAISNLVDPALTTINYPGIDMGEITARSLINHLNGTSNIRQTNTIVVRSGLIVRNSSLKRKGSE